MWAIFTRMGRRSWSWLTVLAMALSLVVPFAPAASVEASMARASRFVSLSPVRLTETRANELGFGGFTRVSPNVIRVQVAGRGGVPDNAVAVVVTVTVANASAAGFVTAYPAGESLPLASTINVDKPGRVVANLATVRLGSGGAIELYSNVPIDLIIDLAGAYVPSSSAVAAGRLVTFPGGARRALDTRDNNAGLGRAGLRTVDVAGVGVPATASAVVVNLGVTQAWPGYWTAFPHGESRPLASTINIDGGGQTRNAQAIVRLAPGSQRFDVFAQYGGHLIVDVVGYFTGDSSPVATDGLFIPTAPVRVIDTRTRQPLAPWGGTTVEFPSRTPLPGSTAAAAVNITVTDPLDVGFVTAFPAGVPRPFSANVNLDAFDQTIANHGTVRLGTRGISVFTQSGTHLVVDVTGWYLGAPDRSGAAAPNPDPGITSSASIAAPRLKTVQVGYGTNLDAIVDTGRAAIWGGSGWLGVPDHNIFFAHRTTVGGPWRNIHLLTPGTRFNVRGVNGATFVYQVVERAIIAPVPSQLLALATRAGQATVTLVACHPPGSVRYRYVVTARLVGAA
jgi:hypothetical protein